MTDIPSKDPADESSLGGTLRSVFRKMMQSTDSMLPARVLSYDRATNTATVQPNIALLTTSGTKVPRAQVAKVPVLALGGGGFTINFPLQPGDHGWIESSDRDISLFLQGMEADTQPNTLRMHSFEDGRFIPDVFGSFDFSSVADDAMTIQNQDGTVRVEISPTEIKYIAPQHTFIGPVKFEDETTFDALATFNDDTITNGIRFTTHTHGGVQTGGGNTGVPNP